MCQNSVVNTLSAFSNKLVFLSGGHSDNKRVPVSGSSLGRLHMGGFVPPYGGDKCRGTKR